MNIYSKTMVSTIAIFLIGIMLGVLVDNMRVSEIKSSLSESEMSWEDYRLLNTFIGTLRGDECESALKQNLEYNSMIYKFGSEIENKIKVSRFSPEAQQEWNRYVLLQFQFWMNSIELKEKCGFDYSNVVYVSRMVEGGSEEVDNRLQSNILLDIKERCGSEIMLIPLTAEFGLESVSAIVSYYNITKFPAVIVDEEYVFQGMTEASEIEKHIGC